MSHKIDEAIAAAQDASEKLDKIAENVGASEPVAEAPVVEPIHFPAVKRPFFDVLYDDETSVVWIGMKLRQTMKGQKTYPNGQRGPVEDVEVNADAVGCLVGLDSAKQEVLIALNRDAQALAEKRARQEALKAPVGPQGKSLFDRLKSGLGAVGAGKSLIH